ncbi:glycine-rich domain-containing protein [Ruminiclostridium papyrosolvens]|uniref:Glycine-rich domain-containing protein n=1 Tax=Ruminiclostridium papyrosolvens C7 TaxID=1330534 RepID=U4QXW5_9FIRM|nr:hypothetical protein [Ruminiclostridium papyrosolvens]EPR07752.1 hypothetical protein L323_19825 [Ruminiclostridium papyrosolvens C7]
MAEVYQKTTWIDHIVDPESGQVLQQGTRFTAEKMNNIEQGIEDAQNLASNTQSVLKQYTDDKIAELIASAPAALDTLNELSDALGADPNFATTITNLIGTKANQTDLDTHKLDYVRQPYSGRVDSDSTPTNYKVTLTPPLTAYEDGLPITIIPNVDCGESPTLDICGLGATPLLDAEGARLTTGVMKANKPYSFVRVGSNFFIRSGSGGKPLEVNYTGSCKIVAETATKGYIECYSSGTLSFIDRLPQTVDVFLVGGGGGGSSSGSTYTGGGGGGGGYTKTFFKVKPSTPIAIYVGAGGASGSSGGSSTYTGLTSASGGNGATSSNGANGGSAGGGGNILSSTTWSYNGVAGSNGGNGINPIYSSGGNSGAGVNGSGQGTPTTDFFGRIHAGGGAGGGGGNTSGSNYSGGGSGNAPGASAFITGSGSEGGLGTVGLVMSSGGPGGGGYGGGGGGGGYGSPRGNGGTGGSGIVIIRWGY